MKISKRTWLTVRLYLVSEPGNWLKKRVNERREGRRTREDDQCADEQQYRQERHEPPLLFVFDEKEELFQQRLLGHRFLVEIRVFRDASIVFLSNTAPLRSRY